MPGMCRPIDEGGFGFDWKLNMAIPDMWIQVSPTYRPEVIYDHPRHVDTGKPELLAESYI